MIMGLFRTEGGRFHVTTNRSSDKTIIRLGFADAIFVGFTSSFTWVICHLFSLFSNTIFYYCNDFITVP